VLWKGISRCGKIGPWVLRNFFHFDANRVFENARLNRGNPYDFSFKKLLHFTFFAIVKIFPDVEKLGLVFAQLFLCFVQIGFSKIDALTEDFHTIFRSKNFYILHFFDFCEWQKFPDVEKLALGFSQIFFVSMQIGFFILIALTEEIHTFFSSKNFYFLHFLNFLNGGNFVARISRCGKIGPCFSVNFFCFRCKSCFQK
jgi:hypothetical protein